MNIGDIAQTFIRAAEIDRNMREHVGPAALRAQQLPYVHTQADKNGWRKEPGRRVVDKKGRLIRGDWLVEGEDPLADERKAFWERVGLMPTSEELSAMEVVFDWLTGLDDDCERRALLAWARAKAGGKSFRRWCFKVEDIHPETGRRRKDRALQRISDHLAGKRDLHDENREIRVLSCGHEISDVSDTITEDAGERDQLNSWLADGAFAPFVEDTPASAFSWAAKRNELRRQRETRRRKEA
ncbi:hypothetical protein EDC40_103666 [Aminobacter aminovorans]|uniref:Uncharacterized protein n=1 Tax=Aminobacter aminovorans TaxID=83263 RepID=A0A380WM55_AMIAI|nr:hypothetical protein [Aminobacter aminovorans]TCS28197.1 hypothetical protein EDC40_103666 [Aminobacter aminovorans]SUU89392.1 Uncharacterised protein [Aminobacter aminovorans]